MPSSPHTRIWFVDSSHSHERLDIFLRAHCPEISRSQIQRAIRDGYVTVNYRTTSVHQFLKQEDIIRWKEVEMLLAQKKTSKKMLSIIPRLIKETDEWLVLHKPTGFLIHPTPRTSSGTLVDWLILHDPKIARVGEHPDRPGIVHRLDKETSGLLVVAKTQNAYENLQQQFARREVQKHYLALSYGSITRDEGDIKFRIAHSSRRPRMSARPMQDKEGKAAWTHYRVKQRFTQATLLELEIISGRTHQIRAHLHAIGHPIMGDPLYSASKKNKSLHAPRLMLQNISLSFLDPSTNERKTFTTHLDKDFTYFLHSLTSQ